MGDESSIAEVSDSLTENTHDSKYQIELKGDKKVDPQGMVDKVMGDLKKHRIRAILHARRNLRDSEEKEPEAFSLTDIPLRRFSKDIANPIIEDVVGSLIVRGSLAESRMGSFYTPNRVYRREDGGIELRGASYFVSHDSNKPRPTEKLDTIERDFRDGLSVLEQVSRPKNEKEFLMYLGVLDYLKIHSLSILHAVTYDERNGKLPTDEEDRGDYMEVREQAVDLMRKSVRAFYQAAAGLPFDQDADFESMDDQMEELVIYLRKNIQDDEYYKLLTYPELNNPITVMLGAHEAALQNPDTQTILGLASGGTESAAAIQFFHEFIYGKTPDLVMLPLSFHSIKITSQDKNRDIPIDQFVQAMQQIYPYSFADKSVLLVDDNSNTGLTLQTAENIIAGLGARTTEAHIGQHDPERLMYKVTKANSRYGRVFDMAHPKYQTTMGVVPVSERRDSTTVRIKERIKDYYSKL